MNKYVWIVLAICVAAVIALSLPSGPPPAKTHQTPSNYGMQDPLLRAIHSRNYAQVKNIVKSDPGILRRLHKQGGTYPNCAASTRDTKMMKLIIDLGADVNFAAKCGTTPLMMAVTQEDIPMAAMLLRMGADPNKHGGSTSALDVAEQKRNRELAELLRKYGAK